MPEVRNLGILCGIAAALTIFPPTGRGEGISISLGYLLLYLVSNLATNYCARRGGGGIERAEDVNDLSIATCSFVC